MGDRGDHCVAELDPSEGTIDFPKTAGHCTILKEKRPVISHGPPLVGSKPRKPLPVYVAA